jgi:pimeloyl-ACP methyl ester carboxylesterase
MYYTRLLVSTSFLAAILISAPDTQSAPSQDKLKRLEDMNPVPADQPIPMIDFFRSPQLSQVVIAPDGKKFAAVVTSNNTTLAELVVQDFSTGNRQSLAGQYLADVREVFWLNEHRLIFSIERHDSTGSAFDLVLTDIRKIDKPLLSELRFADYLGRRVEDPLHPLVYQIGYSKSDVYMLNAETMNWSSFAMPISKRIRAPNKENILGYFISAKGNLRAAISTERGIETLHSLENGTWRALTINLDKIKIVGPDVDADKMMVVYREQPVQSGTLARLDLVSGRTDGTIHQDAAYDSYHSPYQHPETGSPLGVQLLRKVSETVWFDQEYEKLQAKLNKALSGFNVRILNSDFDEQKFSVLAQSDRHPGIYLIYDKASDTLAPLGMARPWIDPSRSLPMRHFSFKNRDGIMLEGYILTPTKTETNKTPPLIVLSGSPWSRITGTWNSQTQYFASLGYAVLVPFTRAAPGISWRFGPDADWDFSGMTRDLIDSVREVVNSGWADGRRVSVISSQLGAYLAIAGAVDEPDLFRCVVSIDGTFDFSAIAKYESHSPSILGGRLLRALGDPSKSRVAYDAISPIRESNRIRIPTFFIHWRTKWAHQHSIQLAEKVRTNNPANQIWTVLFSKNEKDLIVKQLAIYERITSFIETQSNTDNR